MMPETKEPVISTFDQLAAYQLKLRQEAANYRFFIVHGFVTDPDEIRKLYLWYQDDWSIKDNYGLTRMSLIRRMSDADLMQVVDFDKLRFQDSRLRWMIKKRLNISC
jgi:hypothetical protein